MALSAAISGLLFSRKNCADYPSISDIGGNATSTTEASVDLRRRLLTANSKQETHDSFHSQAAYTIASFEIWF